MKYSKSQDYNKGQLRSISVSFSTVIYFYNKTAPKENGKEITMFPAIHEMLYST